MTTWRLLLLTGALAALLGCESRHDGFVRAKEITSPDELVGGPSSKGKVGDLLLENDQVRAVIAGEGQTWVGNTFGGSLVDLDLNRSHRRDDDYGQGWDSFAETFPLVNLIIPDPLKPMRSLSPKDGGLEVETEIGGIEVFKDGSDGEEAIVRVKGSGAYLFQAIKFLNPDLLRTLASTFEFDVMGTPMPLRVLLKGVVDPNLDVYSLLNRLQLDFNFTTDYILHPGDRYVTIRTTVEITPPSDDVLTQCGDLQGCDKDCPWGYVTEERTVEVEGENEPVPVMCPVCECAAEPVDMVPFTEQRSFFGDMLGDLDLWVDPMWRGGMVGGDFLFFGKECNIFIPGLGFDEQRRIFENMWQGVGTLASPLVYPWVGGVGKNVSYVFTSANPAKMPAADCPEHRVALVGVDPAGEDRVAAALVTGFGMTRGAAEGKVRSAIVDRVPIVLPVPAIPTDGAAAREDLEVWRRAEAKRWWASTVRTWSRAEDAPAEVDGLPRLEGDDLERTRSAIERFATLDLVPKAECMPAEIMIPLFTTSATAVITHEDTSGLVMGPEDRARLDKRVFSWERWLVVGDGDVGSALEVVHQLRDERVGWVKGVVLEDGTGTPVYHANVFAVRDPRPVLGRKDRFASWEELEAACVEAFGNEGVVSQMQTDRGLDPVHDGNYEGPLLPGGYFLVAKTLDRRASRPVPVTVVPGHTEIVHLLLEPPAKVLVRAFDQGGQLVPAKVVLVQVDENGRELPWDGRGEVELGDSRFDRGIRRAEFAPHGELVLEAEPGSYNLYVSRGIEYSLFRRRVDLKPGETLPVEAMLVHEVDTSGYVSGDFHVHCRPSVDSSFPVEQRVAAAVAEGLEFITSTDHDQLTDYTPYILEMGLQRFIGSQVGVETTTLEFGHYNAYPLKYDHRDWAEHDPPPWFGLSSQEVFDAMRSRADPDGGKLIVQINHPWDSFLGYFYQAGLHGYDLERSTPGMETCNPQTERISCDFDAVEVLNEKRFELVRTPTVKEVDDHDRCYKQILSTHDLSRFALPEGMGPGDPGLDDVVCGWLQAPDPACDGIGARLDATPQNQPGYQELLDHAAHCHWQEELRAGFAVCAQEGVTPIRCKRSAIDALKHYSVRRMLERTMEEQDAFLTMREDGDPGCSMHKATAGCQAITSDDGTLQAGCGGDSCACEACVCELHPECCKAPGDDDGTGWTDVCAQSCREECHGCGEQPCTEKTQMLDTWFVMLNQGFTPTGMGNSDSHDRKKEVGIPRNFLRVPTERPDLLERADVNDAISRGRVIMSTGPFIDFSIGGAQVGDVYVPPEGTEQLELAIRVQTPSWFSVDHVEIYHDGRLVDQVRFESPKEAIVDYDAVVMLPKPDQDGWYSVVAYGLGDDASLSPPYNSLSYGHMLISTVIGLGATQILGSFDALMAKLDELMPLFAPFLEDRGIDPENPIGSLAMSHEMPDNFPTMPIAITNPIFVDLSGDGWDPPAGRDANHDGQYDLPAFCAQPCRVALDPETSEPTRSTCGLNQVCVPDEPGSPTGTCTIPVPDYCPPDTFGTGAKALVVGGEVVPQAQQGIQAPWDATRVVERLLKRRFLGVSH